MSVRIKYLYDNSLQTVYPQYFNKIPSVFRKYIIRKSTDFHAEAAARIATVTHGVTLCP